MTALCERCGQALPEKRPPPDPAFDDESWTVRIAGCKGELWAPGALSWAILSELRKFAGRLVTEEQLLGRINGGRRDPTTPHCLRVTVYQINRRLAATPWSIRRVTGRGYIMGKRIGAMAQTSRRLPKLLPDEVAALKTMRDKGASLDVATGTLDVVSRETVRKHLP